MAPERSERTSRRARARGWILVVAAASALAARSASGWSEPDLARHAMVVSQDAGSSRIGLEVLREGGNAVDAAVATAFALAVRHPRSGNIGGGGFLLYRPPSGEPVVIDFREIAPRAAREDMFLRDGAYDGTINHEGGLSIGVPGSVAGLHAAWKAHGRLPWKRLLQPAIAAARDGFVVTERLARDFREEALPRMNAYPASRAVFTRNGAPWQAGDLFRQPDLAATLRRIADRGADGFYTGETADRIVAAVAAAGGIITREDLAAYHPVVRKPLRGRYRGIEVLAPPPPAGGVVLLEALNLLDGFDLVSPPGPDDPAARKVATAAAGGTEVGSRPAEAAGGAWRASTVHLIVESLRRAFTDRARFLGDPAYNPAMPVDRLLSADYAARLRATIQMDAASVSSPDILDGEPMAGPGTGERPGAAGSKPPGAERWSIAAAVSRTSPDAQYGLRDPAEGMQTTHLSVVDAEGGAVSLTTTLEDYYGSAIVVGGGGFLLNNEMGDFNPIPGVTTTTGLVGTRPNRVAPGKRMQSSMTPAILVRDGKPLLVVGSPGGRTIISTVLLAIVNVVDFGMNAQEAVDAPRFHHQWLPDRIAYEARGLSPDTRAILLAKGHHLFEVAEQGVAQAILREQDTGVLQGGWDRRWSDGGAAGY